MRWWLVGALALLGAVAVGVMLRHDVGVDLSWLTRGLQHVDRVEVDVAAKDETIRALAAKIGELSRQADAARGRALEAERLAGGHRARALELAARVAELEQQARQRRPVTTSKEVEDAFARSGLAVR